MSILAWLLLLAVALGFVTGLTWRLVFADICACGLTHSGLRMLWWGDGRVLGVSSVPQLLSARLSRDIQSLLSKLMYNLRERKRILSLE